MSTKPDNNQIAKLKADGLYGSTKDAQWNKKMKRHDCCGSPRAYYHLKGCPLCRDLD